MKKSIFLFAFTLAVTQVLGQDFSHLKDVKLTKVEEYKPAEGQVLECSNYLLSTPVKKDDINQLYGIQYILKWMEGTPDYTFAIDDEVMKLTKGDTDLMSLYFAALSKSVLENEGKNLSREEMTRQAMKYLIDYCEDPGNGAKKTKAIKKILKERAK
jgi:hypothetical protein